MRVALINSPSLAVRPVSRSMAGGLGFDGGEHMLLPPLDLAIMAATLRAAGDDVLVIDADPLHLDAAGVIALVAQGTWDILVATVSLPTLEEDAAFLHTLGERHPDARVYGKTMIRDQPALRALLERSGAHGVIHAEADLTITDLVHADVRTGTAWLEPGETAGGALVLQFDAGVPVADLNTLPIAARDLLPLDRYTYPLLAGPVATLQTSRGCPYPCGYYCPYPLVEGVKWRAQSPERIVAELADVVERLGITQIYFRDATFTLDQDRIAAVCDRIVAAGWRIEWVCETRVDCLGDALLEKMRAAGCVGILVGVETGDERVMHLRQGKKGLTVPKLAHLRARAAALGIKLHFLLIVGLPHGNRESIVATYDLVRRFEPDSIGVTVITPYPGTPLHADGVREGWLESFRWQDYGGHQVPMHTPHMSREELLTGKRFLDEGFAVVQRRRVGGHSLPTETLARQHYDGLLRWAYGLDAAVAELQAAAASVANLKADTRRPAAPASAPAERPAPAVRVVSGDVAGPAPALSVVIPTWNRRAILRKTLFAFASQTVPPETFEVVVADDGSTDDTLAMIEGFKAPFGLRVLALEHGGANAARNAGIRAARGAIVVITGDDMVPEPGFIESHQRAHGRHPAELDAVLGYIDWSPEIPVTPFMRHIVSPEGGQQFGFFAVREQAPDFRYFYTSNVSLKRSLLTRQTTLFDPDFTYPAYDDTELGHRLFSQGMQLHFEPRAVTCHHHVITVEGFVERQRRAGQMAVVLGRKHPELGASLFDLANTRADHAPHEAAECERLLTAVRELEKPDHGILATVRANGEGLDRIYARVILAPLWNALLQTAHALGVQEGLAEPPPARAGEFTASIVIPVFNRLDLTTQCLVKLAENTHDVDYEVIVVDNGSSDGTAELLAGLGGDVQVIRNPENLGFAPACNQGARAARGRYIVFLNNDTIPLPGWLSALVAEVETHPKVAVVGSKLLYGDGTIQHAGVAFAREFVGPYHIYGMQPGDSPSVNLRRELQCVTGACMLVRREVFDTLGGFDEGYRNGFEDVDFCLQVGDQGWTIVYQPASVLYHLESQTPGRKTHDEANFSRLLARWGKNWWLADEDEIYVEGGHYKQLLPPIGAQRRVRLEAITTDEAHRQWALVAATQRAARKRRFDLVRVGLQDAAAWPADAGILRWAAGVCGHLLAPELAGGFWQRVAALEDDVVPKLALSRLALERGDLAEAEALAETVLAGQPESGEGWFLRGSIALRRDAWTDATAAFDRALRLGANPQETTLAAGMALVGAGDGDGAWESFRGVVEAHPENDRALDWLVRVGGALERWEALVQVLDGVAAQRPGSAAVRAALTTARDHLTAPPPG